MKQLLADLHARGVRLQRVGDELRVQAKPGTLDEALRQALREHKPELLELLRAGALATADDTPAITHDAAGRHQPFALTELQHAYWLGRDSALDMGSVATHLYVELACHDLDLPRAGQALCSLIRQHDMLRAVVDSQGLQRVLPSVPRYDINTVDASGLPAEAAEAAVLATRDGLSHQVLKADRWPLFDIRATQLPGGETRLHVSLDLLILDAWSIFLFFREWHALYLAPALQTAPAITYRDYLQVEQAQHNSPRHQAAQAYWAARVAQLPGAPELPLQADPAARRAPRFSRREARLPQARWLRLKAAARQQGLTPSSLLLAAYAQVLARWSRTPHFTLNVTTGSRHPWHPEVHRLLGDFTSLVLHEVDAGAQHSGFADFARAQHQRLLLDLEHADHSGVAVRREWARLRGTGLQASMPVVFSSGLVWSGDEEVGNLEQFGRKVYSISQTSQVWLDHHVMELGGDLVLIWDAADAVFEPGVLDAMFECYTDLVERLVDEPALWASPCPTRLPPAMLQRRASEPVVAVPPAQALHAALVAQALARPEALALVAADRCLSFGELLASAAALADGLLAAGVAAGEPVAVVSRKGWEQVAAVLGVLAAGAAYVPVDADLPPLRQAELLRLCGARQVLTQPGGLRGAAAEGPWQVHPIHPGASAPWSAAHAASLAAPPDRLAYIIFTSGTTGVPKGVMIDHAGAANTVLAVNRRFELRASDRVLGVSSLSFDLSVYDIFGVLGAGGALVLPDAQAGHDPAHWRALMQQHGVSLWNSAPQLMRMLLDSLTPQDSVLQGLRCVLLSGDFIPLDLPERLRGLGCSGRITSLGGATEASIWSIWQPIGVVQPDWRSIPYGRAMPQQTVDVLDHALQSTPDQVQGRIYIGGIGLARGYLGDAAATARRFIIHPRSGERLYDTGDLGRFNAQGEIVILGRDDGQIKIRGHRVELGEIEAVLRQHPAVDQAVVLARSTAAGTRALVAWVVPSPAGEVPGREALRAFLAERLPDYMLPQQVLALAHLPLSANGKLDAAALPEPEAAETEAGAGRTAPRNALEQAILQVWQQAIPGLEIGVDDNFFELGGDSVLATRLLRDLNDALPLQLEMHELFENLTVAALARLAAQRLGPADALEDALVDTPPNTPPNTPPKALADTPPNAPAPAAAAGLLAERQALLDDVAALGSALPALPPPAARPLPATGAGQVVLTGATGWVGAHLLAELLRSTPDRVVCIVRPGAATAANTNATANHGATGAAADADSAARQRLLQALQQFGLAINPAALARLQVHAGDLTQPAWGLSPTAWAGLCQHSRCIYHLGASVGVLQAYALHRAHNVLPLRALLQLAATGPAKAVFVLSPMAVCRRLVDGQLQMLAGETLHPDPQGLLTAYAQSKWVAEQVLWQAARQGLALRIYRSSHALPAAASGRVKPNDTYATVLQLARQVDAVPDWPQARLHGVPVDRLCELLVEDSRQAGPTPAVVHLEHLTPPALAGVLAHLVGQRLGLGEVPCVPLALWQQHCLAAAAQLPAAQQLLARGLFESRSGRMAIEHMFSGALADTGSAARAWHHRLASLTPPAYWQRALGADNRPALQLEGAAA